MGEGGLLSIGVTLKQSSAVLGPVLVAFALSSVFFIVLTCASLKPLLRA